MFDASVGGLGGCPFAPRATGNIATEDLVYLLDEEGVETGVDLEALIGVAEWLSGVLGRELPGLVHRAGPFPPGGAQAASSVAGWEARARHPGGLEVDARRRPAGRGHERGPRVATTFKSEYADEVWRHSQARPAASALGNRLSTPPRRPSYIASAA